MGKIKLIAFDLDDTLLNKAKELTPRTLEALELAASSGIEVVPATGRFWDAVPEAVRSLEFIHYAITVNGAEIYDVREKKSLAKFEIPLERAITIARVLDELDCIYDCVIGGFGWMKLEYYDKRSEYAYSDWQLKALTDFRRPVADIYETLRVKNSGVQKVQAFFKDYELREKLLSALPVIFPNNLISSSVSNNIEINDIQANKGAALKFLSSREKLSLSSVLAFGDGLNDMSLIKTAGLGVAMGNACIELKGCADYVVSDCDNDGVAEGINKYCF